jgi:predicted metal-dependent peptidase
MFRYGVAQIDVIQFDSQLQTPQPISLKDAKHLKISEVKGRGGTDFQVVFDYLREHNFYDGMIIFTDGYATQPKIEFFTRTKFVWVLSDEKCYDEHNGWMKKIGRVCYINAK